MQKIVQETQVFAPVISYGFYTMCDELLIEYCENYQKKSYRNRYKILGANGPVVLSIPLEKGKNQQTPIAEVKIAYHEPWYSNHIHSIQSAYGNAPYFDHYADPIFELLRSKEEFLYNFNLQALVLTKELLSLSFKVSKTTIYVHNITDKKDLRNLSKDQNFLLSAIPGYPQVFEDKFNFVPGLSILDLLFNLGPESYLYLKNLSLIIEKSEIK